MLSVSVVEVQRPANLGGSSIGGVVRVFFHFYYNSFYRTVNSGRDYGLLSRGFIFSGVTIYNFLRTVETHSLVL